MRKCEYCGCEIDDKSTSCSYCGGIISSDKELNELSFKNNQMVEQTERRMNKPNGSLIVILLIISSIALFAFIINTLEKSNFFGERRTDDTTQESTMDEQENAGTSEYVLSESNSRYLSTVDLEGLSAEQLRIARNEIYARHGRRFTDAGLQAYFDSKSWYSGTIAPEAFTESMLNEYEIANRDLIVSYEAAKGYR